MIKLSNEDLVCEKALCRRVHVFSVSFHRLCLFFVVCCTRETSTLCFLSLGP